MKLIDAFTFYDAIDVLKMRLMLHSPFVDMFYICESSHAYSGTLKPYNLEKRLHEFAPWAEKIKYIKFEPDLSGLDFSKKDTTVNYNFDSPQWNLEFQQRNVLQKHLSGMDDDDVVIISDMDEFISPQVLAAIKYNSSIQSWEDARLHLQYFHYYMNCIKVGIIWSHPFVCKGKKFKNIPNISLHRHLAGIDMYFTDAGWHFSYLGGLDVIMDKFTATSHTEQIAAGLYDRDYVKRCIDFGMDFLLDKPEPKIENCVSAYLPLSVFPPEIKELMRAFPKFVRTNLDEVLMTNDRHTEIEECLKVINSTHEDTLKDMNDCSDDEAQYNGPLYGEAAGTIDYPALVELASRLEGKDKKTCDLALYCLKKQDKRISKLHAQIAELERQLACSIVNGNE